jgi:alkylation response protein AidB-like acyl-CoA dehydrogenase
MSLISKQVPVIHSDAEALSVARELAAHFKRDSALRDRERRLPYDELELFSHSGLWGISVPKAYGGAGVSNVTLAHVIALIAAADASLGQIPQNHFMHSKYCGSMAATNKNNGCMPKCWPGSASAMPWLKSALKPPTTAPASPGQGRTRLPHHRPQVLRHRRTVRPADPYLGRRRKRYPASGVCAPRQRRPDVIDDWSGFGQRTTGSGSVVFDNVLGRRPGRDPLPDRLRAPDPCGPAGADSSRSHRHWYRPRRL